MNIHVIRMLALTALLILSACQPVEQVDMSEYIQPDPETYVSLMPVIREYFFYLKQAVITGEIDTFFQHYPELQTGVDLDQGINTAANHIASVQSLTPMDGNIFPEYYEKIKALQTGTGIEILVHGMELYIWKDAESVFQESGGEFKIVLHLRKEGDGWQVYRTDEVTLAEWRDF